MQETFINRFKANLSQTDLDLFKKLGLQEFRELPAHNSFVCGTAKTDSGSVHVQVHSMPAKFWTFTIHRNDAEEVEIMETGSGDLHQFWPYVEAVLEGKFGMRTEKATPFIAGWHFVEDDPDIHIAPEDENDKVYVCNITGLVIVGNVDSDCSTVYKQQEFNGTFDECVQYLTKQQEEHK